MLSLERAAQWNGWKCDYDSAIKVLREKLDDESKVIAAQDFRHLVQSENESVADFIHRLERSFRRGYGNDKMPETRDALLFAQVQEGLKYGLMDSPAVSGAASY